MLCTYAFFMSLTLAMYSMIALSLAVNIQDRINTLNSIVHQFDHDDENLHNEEIQQGAANALCQKLMIAMVQYNHKRDYRSTILGMKEIKLVCRALRFAYRCSAHVKEESFRQIGNDLMPLLCSVVSLCLDDSLISPNQHKVSKEKDKTNNNMQISRIDEQKRATDIDSGAEALEGALGALRNLSCVPSAENMMSKHPGFLELLLRVENSDTSTDAKVNALNIIVNLAHSYVNKAAMVENNKLLDMLVRCAHHDEDMVRNAAACGLQNLTAHDENILTIIKHEGIIIATLDLLDDDNSETREFAAGTIQNLSVANQNALPLALFNHGRVIRELLKVIAKDKHDVARNRCVWTLGNIICLDTLFIIKISGVIDILAVAAAKDSLEDTRIQAALIFKLSVTLLLKKLEPSSKQAK